MSFTINSVVFKVFLPILVGLAIFATLDSIKVDSLDPQVDSLGDALNSFNREIVLANTDEEQQSLTGEQSAKARGKLREAVILNVMISQNCGLTLKPEEANVVNVQEEFQQSTWEELKNLAEGSAQSSSTSIFYPYEEDNEYYRSTDEESDGPYAALREDDVGISCAGADQLSSNIPGASALTENEGNDMEGRYGRVGFEVANNFTVKDTRVAAFRFPNLGGEGSEGVYTELLMGGKVLTFAPDGCQDSSFYDSKVRMQNIPVIIEGSSSQEPCNGPKLEYNALDINYMMCEGATGYIQTNVGGQTGEHTLEGDNQHAARYFNFVGEAGGVIESGVEFTQGFEIPDFFSESAGDLSGFVERQFVQVDLNPKVLVRQKGDDCLEGLTLDDESKVIGPAIDHNNDGDRERCEFDDFESYGENSREWNDLNVTCGLVKESAQQEGFEYYRPVWYVEDRQFCFDEAEVKDGYRITSGSLDSIKFDEGVVMTRDDGQPRNDVAYDLSYLQEIEKVVLEYESSPESAVSVAVNDNYPVFKVHDAHSEMYFEEIIKNEDFDEIEAEYEAEKIGEGRQDHLLTLNPSEGTFDWRWSEGNDRMRYTGELESLPDEISSVEFRQAGGNEAEDVKLKSIEISGGSAC
ncbi:MAG: hypothetical protein ACI8Z7_000059 [Candidatus Nanohaloarchaea archaeon]|jgi:hypothetical protein